MLTIASDQEAFPEKIFYNKKKIQNSGIRSFDTNVRVLSYAWHVIVCQFIGRNGTVFNNCINFWPDCLDKRLVRYRMIVYSAVNVKMKQYRLHRLILERLLIFSQVSVTSYDKPNIISYALRSPVCYYSKLTFFHKSVFCIQLPFIPASSYICKLTDCLI